MLLTTNVDCWLPYNMDLRKHDVFQRSFARYSPSSHLLLLVIEVVLLFFTKRVYVGGCRVDVGITKRQQLCSVVVEGGVVTISDVQFHSYEDTRLPVHCLGRFQFDCVILWNY